MQIAFAFGVETDVAYVLARLDAALGPAAIARLRTPVGQLIKSLISARTRDEVSLAAYDRLVDRYPSWAQIASAPAGDIEALIAEVTFADVKARRLRLALHIIASDRSDFDLTFLKAWTIDDALAWLERLPGVGRKVAASTLNFSTLALPAFVIDTHVLRVLRRFGLVRPSADIEAVYEAVMASADWNADDMSRLHILLKHLGQALCRADAALCRQCPLAMRCRSAPADGDRSRHTGLRTDRPQDSYRS